MNIPTTEHSSFLSESLEVNSEDNHYSSSTSSSTSPLIQSPPIPQYSINLSSFSESESPSQRHSNLQSESVTSQNESDTPTMHTPSSTYNTLNTNSELYLQKYFKIKLLQNFILKAETILEQLITGDTEDSNENQCIRTLHSSYIFSEINKIFSYIHLFNSLSDLFIDKIKNIMYKYNKYIQHILLDKDYEIRNLQRRIKYLQTNNIYFQNKNTTLQELQPRCSCCWSSNGPFVIFLPCLHVTCCKECGSMVESCPICLTQIKISNKVFIKTDGDIPSNQDNDAKSHLNVRISEETTNGTIETDDSVNDELDDNVEY